MTAVEWLIEQIITDHNKNALTRIEWMKVFKQAKEMEKQQIIDAFGIGCHHESKRLVGYQDVAEQYYNETYGSKGSDDHIVDTNEMGKAATISKKEIVEISDEEIIKAAFEHCVDIYQKVSDYENYDTYNDFILGALWYREQLR